MAYRVYIKNDYKPEIVLPVEMDKFNIQSSYLFALLDTADLGLLAQYESKDKL